MLKTINNTFCRVAVVALTAAALAGCSGNKANVQDGTAHAATVQADTIKNDPHIPDAAKAQILSSMQQQHGSGAKSQPH